MHDLPLWQGVHTRCCCTRLGLQSKPLVRTVRRWTGGTQRVNTREPLAFSTPYHAEVDSVEAIAQECRVMPSRPVPHQFLVRTTLPSTAALNEQAPLVLVPLPQVPVLDAVESQTHAVELHGPPHQQHDTPYRPTATTDAVGTDALSRVSASLHSGQPLASSTSKKLRACGVQWAGIEYLRIDPVRVSAFNPRAP